MIIQYINVVELISGDESLKCANLIWLMSHCKSLQYIYITWLLELDY